MARKRTRRNNDSSAFAIALNSHWGVSAAFSALVFGVAYVIAPAYVKSSVILTSVRGWGRDSCKETWSVPDCSVRRAA